MLHLESHGLLTRLLRLLTVPALNHIPAYLLRSTMQRTSRDAATVTKNGGSTTALEAMYTRHHRRPFSRGLFQGIADYFWHHVISQPKALRNRLAIVESLLEEEIVNRTGLSPAGGSLALLNVAGGSSRAVIHTLVKLGETAAVKVTNIDKDERAIALGKRLAEASGVSDSFRWVLGDVRTLGHILPGERFDLIEVVGLLDYFSDAKFVALLTTLHEHLTEGGALIIANVMPNAEAPFVRKTGWPEMFYRRPKEVTALLTASGFRGQSDILLEPLGVHAVFRTRI